MNSVSIEAIYLTMQWLENLFDVFVRKNVFVKRIYCEDLPEETFELLAEIK